MSRQRNLVVGWTLAVLAIALFVRLGAWQAHRAVEKQAMLDAAAKVLAARAAKPLSIAADAQRTREYDWSAGTGRFEAGGAWLLDNQMRDGRAGVRVYRVLHPRATQAPPGDGPLLVDLGWVPLSADRRMPVLAPVPSGDVEVRGLLAPPPSSGLATGPAFVAQDGQRLMTRVDVAQMSRALALAVPLAPRVLRLDPALPFGHARDLQLLPNTLPPEKHRGYSLQWFALAIAVLATALILTFRKPRRHEPR